jgi:HEPN domain-containing protein
MINIERQIEYWRKTAESDIDTAKILTQSGKYVEGMFFCHLSVEKIIKAIIVRRVEDIPPKSHDLFYLASIAKIEITEVQSEFIQILMKYQLEGRYPEYYPRAPKPEKINEYLRQTQELLLCLKKML